ncbi:unnamed protein product [Colletotrichum noveboracense]|uniref:Uncharacterized protein n=1 Tax=Colletotrichum noveboracense TaxID=2664923 RepID=A0A9W4S4X5_9PEZI|nr:unnamed protein product [Colletotrichum noveboracense]
MAGTRRPIGVSKRPMIPMKRPIDTFDFAETSPKRHHPDPHSTEGILSRIAPSDLKSCFHKALKAESERTKRQADEIRKKASRAVAKATEDAYDPQNRTFHIEHIRKAVDPFVRHALDLWRSGSRANAPSLVSDLLMDFADRLIWKEWDFSVCGDNEDNDYVHLDIEDIFVGIVREELERCEDPKQWLQRDKTKDWASKVNRLNTSIDENNINKSSCHKYVRLKRLLETGTEKD